MVIVGGESWGCFFGLFGVGGLCTYVDAPEFFHGAESNDFFEQIVPVITLEKD